MDLPSLVSELHLRGFSQEKADSAIRCLVHVYSLQDSASDIGGVLSEDIVSAYPLDVVQVASQLFLDKVKSNGRELYRVRWGCEEVAKTLQGQLWEHGENHWREYVRQLDERYLGVLMPPTDEGARVITAWKLRKELKWFSTEVPRHGWNVLRIVNDITDMAQRLGLAFSYGVLEPGKQKAEKRVLLHERAYELLKQKKVPPPQEAVQSVRLWRFFSEYDVNSTDFVALMEQCDLSLEEVVTQVQRFFSMDLTSQYRDGQYPPYFINKKKMKDFQAEVKGLLRPMDVWLSRELRATGSAEMTAPQTQDVSPAAADMDSQSITP